MLCRLPPYESALVNKLRTWACELRTFAMASAAEETPSPSAVREKAGI